MNNEHAEKLCDELETVLRRYLDKTVTGIEAVGILVLLQHGLMRVTIHYKHYLTRCPARA